jgi:hypothetical protein
MKNTLLTLITLAISATLSAQSTLLVTHADGTTHQFIIPLEMEQSFDAIRAVRVQRDQPNPKTPNIPGAITREEKNTGDLVEALLLETYQRAIQQPQFQPAGLKAQVDTAVKAAQDAAEKAAKDAEKEMKKSRKKNGEKLSPAVGAGSVK